MDRFFVIITVQASNPARVITNTGNIFETDPVKRFTSVFQMVCQRNGLSEDATSVLFYSVEKMPAA